MSEETKQNTQEIEQINKRINNIILRIQELDPKQEDTNESSGNLLIQSEGKKIDSAGNLKAMNEYLQELTLHEYQKVNNILEKDHRQKNKTIMNQSLGEIMEDTVNFLSNSVDNMYEKYNEAELIDMTPKDKQDTLYKIKTYLLAFILFIRDDKNVVYLGILCIIVANIILFFNITTS